MPQIASVVNTDIVSIVKRMADALPLRIFLASPGDLTDERQVVRTCIEEFNLRRMGETNVAYEVVGWERVRGTARRPQDAINELILESHFLIALFKGSWGSEPGSPWGYTSGTEEELFTGLLELGRAEQPMRDVWVAFLAHDSPAPQITRLRNQMAERHSMMYEAISDPPELKKKLTERLLAWEALAGRKVARHIELLPSTGKDVLRAANLRIHGEKLVELGQADAGLNALKEASVLGGPPEHLAYARFLARQGDLDEAHRATQRAISHFADGTSPLYSPLAADAFATQAGVMRRQGRTVDAIGRLEQALTLVGVDDDYSRRIRAKLLDDLGLARQAVDDLSGARRDFEEGLATRRQSQRKADICQSLVNLARLAVREEDLESAAATLEEVFENLEGAPPSALHANASVLAAQIRLRQSRPAEGLRFAEKALSLNRQIASTRGEAIALLLLAQCSRAVGNNENAKVHAQACLALNESMMNDQGARRGRWLLDQLT